MSKAGKSSKGKATKTAKAAKTARKRMQLPQVLDLTAAAPLAKSILSRRGAELSVDASRVNRVGAQCLQVLLAAAATWKSDGVRFSLVKPSAEFSEGGRLLGIQLDQATAGRELA
jgi:chemotaxis protein CheX